MIEVSRRNYPITLNRPIFKKFGKHFTEYAISIRSVSKANLSKEFLLHYLSNGTCCICLSFNRSTYILPLMLIIKALVNKSDIEIYKEMIFTKEDDTYFTSCIQSMLRDLQAHNFFDAQSIYKYIGEKFRHKFIYPEWYSDEECAEKFLRRHILVHLDNDEDKFRMLCLMTRKLFDFALSKCFSDPIDSVQIGELLLPGHVMQILTADRLSVWMQNVRRASIKILDSHPQTRFTMEFVHRCLSIGSNVSTSLQTFLATGNISIKGKMDGIPQTEGLAIFAEKLNLLRYIAQFRAVFKGKRFVEMRDTRMRRLTADCWGFLCPVHTPDGSPCGLLNHMSHLCEVVTHPFSTDKVVSFFYDHGLISSSSHLFTGKAVSKFYFVLLDGCLLGWIPVTFAKSIEQKLRLQKAVKNSGIPSTLEICLIEYSDSPTQYPGFYLFSEPARMVRPVLQTASGNIEFIGTFEQMYMDICVIPEEAHELTTHQEITQHSILSAVACLIPFSDHNQSPQNMYQCQMAKQTMGNPTNTIMFRSDLKLYRLITPQSPIVRPYMHDRYCLDGHSLGTNAVVAVISYTGYDMEDAMIINKSSLQRGFCWGSLYKTMVIDLHDSGLDKNGPVSFGCIPNSEPAKLGLVEPDGFPPIGRRLEGKTPLYGVNTATKMQQFINYDSSEVAYVDNVKMFGVGSEECTRASITYRVPRNPIIGDKFASRAGQKGICSRLWPTESIPFTESGMFPDIIFNPHGFPSRMTIGMMIESMAGKAAAVNGGCYDATPFTFTEDDTAIDYFGKILTKSGFNYYGTETMYSGVSGLQLRAEIFFGIVYYQRLRHMVSDKFQVRTTGPVDALTQQPIKGRQFGGGVRFGEMERDALLSHGAAMLLHDRLLVNSDLTQAYVCEQCKSLLSPILEFKSGTKKNRWICKLCKSTERLSLINIPHTFRYLCHELAAMNIKLEISLK